MSPFNDVADATTPSNNNNNSNNYPLPSHISAPVDGAAVSDSLDFRAKMGRQYPHRQPPPRPSPRRQAAATRTRPPSDVPSSSSSGSQKSWVGELFPRSHPGNAQPLHHAQPQPQTRQNPRSPSASASNNPVNHPHIRELMERQRQRSRQMEQERKQSMIYQQHPHHVRADASLRAEQRQREMSHQQRSHQQHHQNHQQQHHQQQHQQADDNHDGAGGTSIVHGLHMEHVLNDHYGEGRYDEGRRRRDRGSYPAPLAHNASAHLSSPLNHAGGSPIAIDLNAPPPLSEQFRRTTAPLDGRPPDGPPPTASLPKHTVNVDGDYVVEGTFHNGGCMCQTADDVGYLFGCGTRPEDEVVFVYNTRPERPRDPPAARADERNLFYHRGPDYDAIAGADVADAVEGGMGRPMGGPAVGMGGMGDAAAGGGDNVNDIMFQIDREYQAMKAAHEGNMGYDAAATNNDLLMRDPPPPGNVGGIRHASSADPPHGHYRVVHEDDDNYTRASSCMSGLMNFILPGGRRDGRRQRPSGARLRSHSASPRMASSNGDRDPGVDYRLPRRNYEDPGHSTGYFCSSKKQRPPPPPPQLVSSSNSSLGDDSISSLEKAKKGVRELQNQLRAMVNDRARRQQQPRAAGGGGPEETRQEATPPSTPRPRSSPREGGERSRRDAEEAAAAKEKAAKEAEARLASSKAEIERLRHEARSLEQARGALRDELEAHRKKMKEMVDATARAESEREAERLREEREREAQRLKEKQRSLDESREMLREEMERYRERMAAANAGYHGPYSGGLYAPMRLSPTATGGMPATGPAVLSPLTAETPAVMTPQQAVNVGLATSSAPMHANDMNGGMNGGIKYGTNGGTNNVTNDDMNNRMNGGMNNGMSGGMNNGMSGGMNNVMNGGIGGGAMNNGIGGGVTNPTTSGMNGGINNGVSGNGTNNHVSNGMSYDARTYIGANDGAMGVNSNNLTSNDYGTTGNIGTSYGGAGNSGTGNYGRLGMQNSRAPLQQKQQQQHQQRYQQQKSPQRTQTPTEDDVNSILQDANSVIEQSSFSKGPRGNYANADAKSFASESPFGGAEPSLRSEGKFIDNVGGIGAHPARVGGMGAYSLRPRVSPKTPSGARSPPSRADRGRQLQTQPTDPRTSSTRRQPRDPSPRHQPRDPLRDPRPSARPRGSGGAAAPGPSRMRPDDDEELYQSKGMLHDLRVKNELMQQDIARMKMGGKFRGGGPKYGSSSDREGGVDVASGVRAGSAPPRPFPRTSPPSSPGERHAYGEGGQSHDGYRGIGGVDGGGGQQRQEGYSRRQPPNPMRPNRDGRGQDYYHV